MFGSEQQLFIHALPWGKRVGTLRIEESYLLVGALCTNAVTPVQPATVLHPESPVVGKPTNEPGAVSGAFEGLAWPGALLRPGTHLNFEFEALPKLLYVATYSAFFPAYKLVDLEVPLHVLGAYGLEGEGFFVTVGNGTDNGKDVPVEPIGSLASHTFSDQIVQLKTVFLPEMKWPMVPFPSEWKIVVY